MALFLMDRQNTTVFKPKALVQITALAGAIIDIGFKGKVKKMTRNLLFSQWCHNHKDYVISKQMEFGEFSWQMAQ